VTGRANLRRCWVGASDDGAALEVHFMDHDKTAGRGSYENPHRALHAVTQWVLHGAAVWRRPRSTPAPAPTPEGAR